MIEDLQLALKSEFTGKTLNDASYISLTDEFMVLEEDCHAVFFGALTLHFEDVQLSLAWNTEQLVNDLTKKEVRHLLEEDEAWPIDKGNFAFVSALFDQKIADVDSEWGTYRALDEFEERGGEKRPGLLGLTFKFENGSQLQLASVRLDIDFYESGNELRYAHNGYLLVSTNRDIFVLSKL